MATEDTGRAPGIENGPVGSYVNADDVERLGREAIMATPDPKERVQKMRESGLFDDDEVRQEIGSILRVGGSGGRNASFNNELILENFDLYGKTVHEVERTPLPTGKEVYGADAYKITTTADGELIAHTASPEELAAARRAEILAIKDPKAQLRAIAANVDVFRRDG